MNWEKVFLAVGLQKPQFSVLLVLSWWLSQFVLLAPSHIPRVLRVEGTGVSASVKIQFAITTLTVTSATSSPVL